MYAGRAVEYAPTRTLFSQMRMPYTRALLEAIPGWSGSRTPCSRSPRGSRRTSGAAEGLPVRSRGARHRKCRSAGEQHAPRTSSSIAGRVPLVGLPEPAARTESRCDRRRAHPVDDDAGADTTAAAAGAQRRAGVPCARRGRGQGRRSSTPSPTCPSTSMPGETLGVVGETGSGKSTLARSVMQAPRRRSPARSVPGHRPGRPARTAAQAGPAGHADGVPGPVRLAQPALADRRLVEEPLIGYGDGHRADRRKRVRELLDLVGLNPYVYGRRHPRELSGGQCQRVAIARAIALHPALVVCDEPVSSLDVLSRPRCSTCWSGCAPSSGLSYLFISHDLALVKQVSDRVAVMYLGQLCEVGPAEAMYRSPAAPLHRRAARVDPGASTRTQAAGDRTRGGQRANRRRR